MSRDLLVIPMYNCERQILRVLGSLTEAHCQFFECIILIDNRSSDRTLEVTVGAVRNHALRKKMIVVRNPRNLGLGGTHKMAFLYCEQNNYDSVTILHGDDQAALADFQEVFQTLSRESSSKFYFGARFHPRSHLLNYSPLKTLGNILFNKLFSAVGARDIYDLGSGLNYFPLSLLRLHPYWAYSDDLTFNYYFLCNAVKMKQEVIFVPISWREFDQVSNVRLIRQSLKLLSILLRFNAGDSPIRDTQSEVLESSPANWQKQVGDWAELSV